MLNAQLNDIHHHVINTKPTECLFFCLIFFCLGGGGGGVGEHNIERAKFVLEQLQ